MFYNETLVDLKQKSTLNSPLITIRTMKMYGGVLNSKTINYARQMKEFGRKFLFSSVILFINVVLVYGQDEKVAFSRTSMPSQSLEIGLLDPMGYPLGLQYSQMLSHKSSVVLGAGAFSFGSGFRYFMNDPKTHKLLFSAGIQGSWLWESMGIYDEDLEYITDNNGYTLYMPIGIHYWGRRNFTSSLSIGPLWLDNPRYLGYENSLFQIYFTANVGLRMGYDVANAKNPDPTKMRHLVSGRIGIINPFAGFVYEFLFTPWLSGEVTAGILGVGTGINAYYPALRPGRFSMKAGVQVGISIGYFDPDQTLHFPLGISYLSKNNWVFGLDMGPQRYDEFELPYGISARIGMLLR